MKILDQYIARTVIGGTLMALLVLASLLAFVDFVAEIGKVGHPSYVGYGILDVVMYVLLTLPKRMYEIFPTAVLLGSLLSLGALASNSELTVMRAAGMSIMRITGSVLQAGLILLLLVAFIGEVLVPISERKAQTLKVSSLQQHISLGGRHGFWVRDSMRYIHVGQVYLDLHLGQLDIYELNANNQISRITHAESAQYINNTWQLSNIKRSTLSDTGVSSETLAIEVWPELLNPELFNVLTVKPENMSAMDLYRYSQYLQSNELDASHYQLAFWIKVITPVSSLVMLLIALPFVFSSQRSGGAGQRMLLGLLLGIGFFMANRIMNHMGQVYGITPFISAALPVLLVAIAGGWAIKRQT
jgi:lipopolysaccharide export system permease protein